VRESGSLQCREEWRQRSERRRSKLLMLLLPPLLLLPIGIWKERAFRFQLLLELPLLREIGDAFDELPACFLREFPFLVRISLSTAARAPVRRRAGLLDDEVMEDGGVGGKGEDDEGFGEF
jgi:hypothetical protein